MENSLSDATQIKKYEKQKCHSKLQMEESFFFFPVIDQSVRIGDEGYLKLSLIYNSFWIASFQCVYVPFLSHYEV